MNHTQNYSLNLPERHELVDVDNLNDNFSVIDTELGAHGLKLDSIEYGAEKNTNSFETITVGTGSVAAKNSRDNLDLIAGSNIILSSDPTNNSITIESEHPNVAKSPNTHSANTANNFSYIYDIVVDSFGHVVQMDYKFSSLNGSPYLMKYIGSIGNTSDDIAASLPTTNLFYGDTYLIRSPGTYNGINCSQGDLFIVIDETLPKWEHIPCGGGGSAVTFISKQDYDNLGTVTQSDNVVYFVADTTISPATYSIMANGTNYGGVSDAIKVTYDNTTSQSSSTNVQDALDEIFTNKAQIVRLTQAQFNALPQVEKDKENVLYIITDASSSGGSGGSSGPIKAIDVEYDNATSQLLALNVQEAIDELKKSVSDGKKLVADAITNKGVTTLATDTFQTMATNIDNISVGINSPISFNGNSAYHHHLVDCNLSFTKEFVASTKSTSYYPMEYSSGSGSFDISTGYLLIYVNFNSLNNGYMVKDRVEYGGVNIYLPNGVLRVYPNSQMAYMDSKSTSKYVLYPPTTNDMYTSIDANLSYDAGNYPSSLTESCFVYFKYKITTPILNYHPIVTVPICDFLNTYNNQKWNYTDTQNASPGIDVWIKYSEN